MMSYYPPLAEAGLLQIEQKKVRRLKEVLRQAQEKLMIYREGTDGNYQGGLELSALNRRIAEVLDS